MLAMMNNLLDSVSIPNKDHLHILEIGTGNGDGTTRYIHDYFTRRGTPFTLHSYEGTLDFFAKACPLWRDVPNVELVPKFFCNKRDIEHFVIPNCKEDAPPLTRQHYVDTYRKSLETAQYETSISYVPDVVVIDVWRFCHVAVIKKLIEVCSPQTQIIMEDDFGVYGETEIIQKYFTLLDLRKFNSNHAQTWHFVTFRLLIPSVLYYNHIPMLADHVIDYPRPSYGPLKPKHNYPPFYTNTINPGDIIFVKTDILGQFFQYALPQIQHPFYLLSGVAGLDVNPEYRKYLDSPKILKWIGCNLVWQHPKAMPIPIGVEENERRRGGEADGWGGDQDILRDVLESRKPLEDKIDRLLVTYLGNTHASRASVLDPLKDKDFVDYAPKLPFDQYMARINDYKFVLCPRGAGTDTHRFWEVLLTGSIPVVERNGLAYFYETFPCILVNHFGEVTRELLDSFVLDEEKAARVLQYLRVKDFDALIHTAVGRGSSDETEDH